VPDGPNQHSFTRRLTARPHPGDDGTSGDAVPPGSDSRPARWVETLHRQVTGHLQRDSPPVRDRPWLRRRSVRPAVGHRGQILCRSRADREAALPVAPSICQRRRKKVYCSYLLRSRRPPESHLDTDAAPAASTWLLTLRLYRSDSGPGVSARRRVMSVRSLVCCPSPLLAPNCPVVDCCQ
jgi:hypothetical protein